MGGGGAAGADFGFLLLAGALCAACASYGSHLGARPLPPERRELSLSVDALLIDRGFGPQVLPNPEVGLRLGVSEDLDVGGEVNLAGFEANARFRAFDGRHLDLTLVPGLSFGFVPVTNTDSGLFNVSLLGTVLAGVAVGTESEIVVGTRGIATHAFPLTAFRGDSTGAKMLYLGGGVLGFRASIGRARYIFPELNVLVPYDAEREEWSFPTVQVGVSYQQD